MESTFIYSESARRKAQKKKALAEGEAEQKKLASLGKVPGPDEPWEHRPPHPPEKDLRRAGVPQAVAHSAPAAPAAAKPAARVAHKPQQRNAAAPAPVASAAARAAASAAAQSAAHVSERPAAAQAATTTAAVRFRAQPAASAIARPRAAAPSTAVRPTAKAPAARSPAVRPAGGRAAAQGTAARPAASKPLPAPELKASEERLLLESQVLDLFGTGATTKVCVCPDCHHELVRVVCLGTPVRACLECKGVWLPLAVVRDFARSNEWFAQLGPAIQAMARQPKTP